MAYEPTWCLDTLKLDSAVSALYGRALALGPTAVHRALLHDQDAFLAYVAAEESLAVALKGNPAEVRKSMMRDRRLFFQKLFGEWTELDEASARANMRQDLRNLVEAEENFYGDSTKYTTALTTQYFQPSPGNKLLQLRLTPDGWVAQISTTKTKTVCTIFIGKTPLAPAVAEGKPVCQ